MRVSKFLAIAMGAVATSVILAFVGPTPAVADDTSATDSVVTTTDVQNVLRSSDSSILAGSANTNSDSDSAATTQVNGTAVDVPRDASSGVDLTAPDGTTLNITPPNAEDSGTGKLVATGTVAYPSNDGTATAVQATNDGGVRMLTVIANSDAPTSYPYTVELPDGATIQLTDDGGAVVVASTGEALFSVAAPWAHDASGTNVPTHFETNGSTLTQVVDHTDGNYTYPITADPFWSALGNYLGCIFGVGVPIGAAFVIAALPASWPFIIRWAYQQSANGDRTIISYVTRVHNMCGRFIRG